METACSHRTMLHTHIDIIDQFTYRLHSSPIKVIHQVPYFFGNIKRSIFVGWRTVRIPLQEQPHVVYVSYNPHKTDIRSRREFVWLLEHKSHRLLGPIEDYVLGLYLVLVLNSLPGIRREFHNFCVDSGIDYRV